MTATGNTNELLAVELAAGSPQVESFFKSEFALSARFREFSVQNSPKIRKKFHDAKSDGDQENVAAELKVIRLLLSDHQFSVEYEKYKSKPSRGPDITVSFLSKETTDQAFMFNVEVRHVSKSPKYESHLITQLLTQGFGMGRSSGKEPEKFSGLAIPKLTQFVPTMSNVIVFKITSMGLNPAEMETGLLLLRDVFQRRDDNFLRERTGIDSEQLLPYWRALSVAVYLDCANPTHLWRNPDAIHPLPIAVYNHLGTMGKI